MQGKNEFMELVLENGKFIRHNRVNVEEFSPTHVVGNGWTCTISEQGGITCKASAHYPDGMHTMKYTISPEGHVKHTLKIGNHRPKRFNWFKLEGWKGTGDIGFSDGEIDRRFAYFYTK